MSLENLKLNEQLVRRARLRRALTTHQRKQGFSNKKDLAHHLNESEATIGNDLRAIGAVKLADKIEGQRVEWWAIPAWNPLMPDLRQEIDENALLNELSLKIRAHVLELFVLKDKVFMKTERSAGPLLADWVSLLPWPEIVHVVEQRSSVVIYALDEGSAFDIHARLVGSAEEEA